MTEAPYAIRNTQHLLTPSLVVFEELLERNLHEMLRIAGSPGRLRPHCKTHKTRELIQRWTQLGVTDHKCATFAEAEMAASAGAKDVLLAYNPVGPNLRRVIDFTKGFPDTRFAVTVDHRSMIAALGEGAKAEGVVADVFLDVDTGQHRTGAAPEAGLDLYRQIADSPGLRPRGLHLYDGHNHQTDLAERTEAVDAVWRTGTELAKQLEQAGFPVEEIVAGGTGSFPCFAAYSDPRLRLSPGTCVFHDQGYRECFPDLDFTPAAVVATRVISRPTPDRITLDAGNKAVASDPPMGSRLFFPRLRQARQVLQNEEHLVLETPGADAFQPGDLLLAIPRHICPTCALHDELWVVRAGEIVESWEVASRSRRLSI